MSSSEGVEGPRIPMAPNGLDSLDWPSIFSSGNNWEPVPERYPERASTEPSNAEVGASTHTGPASDGMSYSFQCDSFGPSVELTCGPSAKYSSQAPSVVMPTLGTPPRNITGDGTYSPISSASAPATKAFATSLEERLHESFKHGASARVAKLAEYAERRGWLLEHAQMHVEWLADQALQGGTLAEGPEDKGDAALAELHDELNLGRPGVKMWDDNKWL